MYLGGYNNGTVLDYILSFNITSSEWNQIGSLTRGRDSLAASAVPEDEVLGFCETHIDDIL